MNVPRQISRRSFIAGAASVAALGSLGTLASFSCGTSDEQPVVGQPAADDLSGDGFIIDVATLAQRLDDPALCVIDCSPIRAYRAGHLPGASHLWWQDTIEVNNPVYGMLAGIDKRNVLAANAGVNQDSTVVVYDNAGGLHAARIQWMLHSMGFGQVMVLDGGSPGWRAAGHELTRDSENTPAGTFVGAIDEEVNAHAHDIEVWLERDDIAIIDTRTPNERSETWHDRLRIGMIPGSVWLPRDSLFTEPGSHYLAGRDALLSTLTAAGVDTSIPEVIVYGLHSSLAALPYVVMRSLGVPRVRVYDGSWAEWGAGDRPIAPLP